MSRLRGRPSSDPGAGVMNLIEVSDLRHVPRARIEGLARARTRYAAVAPDVGLARVLGRYKMFVIPDDDAISGHLILDGFWEMWNTIFLAGFVRPGWTVLEVGTHLGYFSLLMSDLAGPTGRLVGFEPVGRSAGLLRRSLAINGFAGRFTLEQTAVSDANGRARIHVPRGNWGGASIIGGPSPDLVAIEDVPTVTLDSYCADRSLRPDFIKMDAEGAEQLIFRGMKDLLANQKKIAIMFEFTSLRTPGWRDWFGELEQQGFALHRVGHDSKLAKITSSIPQPDGLFEVLALRGHSDQSH